MYGAEAASVTALGAATPGLGDPLHEDLPYSGAEILWAVREEMAMSVEDALSRRTRCLLLDAEASISVAPRVARIMAEELGHDEAWCNAQVDAYTRLARGYCLDASS